MRLITFVYLALVTAVPTALSIPLSGDGMVADLEARGIILDPVMMARVAAQQSAAITTSSPAPTTTRIDPVGPLLLNHPHNPSHRRSPGEEDLLKRDPLFGGFGLGFRPPPPDFTSITIFPDPEPTFTSSTSVPTTTRIDPVGSLPINPNRHHRRAFPHGPLGDGLRDRRGIAPGMLGPGGRLFLSQALGATPSKRSPSDHDYLVKRELEDIVRRLVLNIPHRISVPVNTNIPGALPSPPFTQSAPTPQSSTLDHTPLRQPEFVFADENKTAVKRDVLRLMNRRSPKFVVLPDGFETPVFSMPRVSLPSGFISVPVPKFTPSTSTPTPDLAASTATPTQINPVGGTSMDRIHS